MTLLYSVNNIVSKTFCHVTMCKMVDGMQDMKNVSGWILVFWKLPRCLTTRAGESVRGATTARTSTSLVSTTGYWRFVCIWIKEMKHSLQISHQTMTQHDSSTRFVDKLPKLPQTPTTRVTHTQRRVQPDQCYFTMQITGVNFECTL